MCKWRWPSWAPVPNSPYGLCRREATLNLNVSSLIVRTVSVDVRQHTRGHLQRHRKRPTGRHTDLETLEDRELSDSILLPLKVLRDSRTKSKDVVEVASSFCHTKHRVSGRPPSHHQINNTYMLLCAARLRGLS